MMSAPLKTTLRRIISKPEVMGGKPCIAGTRITVEVIVRRFAERYTLAEVLEDYPTISEPDVQAALEYAVSLAGASRGEAA
jgi:uncharacterized protein (DUF433 family)